MLFWVLSWGCFYLERLLLSGSERSGLCEGKLSRDSKGTAKEFGVDRVVGDPLLVYVAQKLKQIRQLVHLFVRGEK